MNIDLFNIKMKNYVLFLCIILFYGGGELSAKESKISLDGVWSYKLDPDDIGYKQKWYNCTFNNVLNLPGSLNTNSIGYNIDVNTKWTGSQWNKDWYESDFYKKYREPGNVKPVFWLTPDKHYVGKAWYQKKIYIPKSWTNNYIALNLERCHWLTNVWIDGVSLGSRNSLSTPHVYNLGDLSAGEHIITICVDNEIKDINPGVDAHSISDNTQSNWNGIIGKIEIVSRPKVNIEKVKIIPDFKSKSIDIDISLNANNINKIKGTIIVQAKRINSNSSHIKPLKYTFNQDNLNKQIFIEYNMENDFCFWDEFNPNLYELSLTIDTKYGKENFSENFGLRKLETKDTQILINNRPAFFRGTLECCIFPKTGFPPTNIEEWDRIMKICKSYGLNHIRFHSWCPPKAAFEAADKNGIYLYVESISWSSNLGDGDNIDNYLYEESNNIINEYGNHPSLCLFSYGNEPHGKDYQTYLRKFVTYWKNKDSRFLYTSAAGWPAFEINDWHCLPAPRIQGWNQGLKSIINSKIPNSKFDWSDKISKSIPTISHEIGQWCAYPDLKERTKYSGAFKAKNFDIFEDRLKDNDMLELADSFLLSSGKLQTLCYKADIEAALRTKNFAGFQLLDLHDFPGQGTALVGVLNPFWEEKGYVKSTEYSHFCNSIVPLARMDKFVYKDGEKLNAEIQVAQYSSSDITSAVEWKIIDSSNKVLYNGSFESKKIVTGSLNDIGKVSQKLDISKPLQLQFVVSVGKYINKWNIWVYPNEQIKKGDVLMASSFDSDVEKFLLDGGKVLLTPRLGSLKNEGKDSVAVGFSTVFWNTLWTNGQAPHTLGILCDNNHPALQLFPTEFHSDYQWWDAMSHCNAIPLNRINNPKPIVRIIDDWFKARPLGLIVELKVGNGRLLLCGADLLSKIDERLEAMQLTKSLLNYMNSNSFNPATETTSKKIKNLFE